MEPSPLFLKARSVGFSCIFAVSFLWVILLSVVSFGRWEVSLPIERVVIIILLCANTITVIVVPFLLIFRFRVWLDVARLIFLLLLHIGSAVGFTYCSALFSCTGPNTNEAGSCRVITICILLASWVNPLLLLVYAAGLSYMLYRLSRISDRESFKSSEKDYEASIDHSVWSMVHPIRPVIMAGPPPRDVRWTPTESDESDYPPWLTPEYCESEIMRQTQTSHQPQLWGYAM